MFYVQKCEEVKGRGGSEGKAKPQRRVVKELGCCLTVCLCEKARERESKDRLGANKGLMTEDRSVLQSKARRVGSNGTLL